MVRDGRSARRVVRRTQWRAVALALIVTAAGCGGNHGSAKATDTTSTAAKGAATTAAAGGAGAAPMFGTLASPCGKGSAKGSTANGVTDSSITIGYGDDAGYAAAPGLDKEMSDAIKAMVTWCNTQGGINGRQVTATYYDAKVTDVTSAMTKACGDKVFMLVGQGWVLDDGQEKTRIGCKLSTIPTYSVATSFANGPGVVEPLPSPGDQVPISSAYQLAAKFPAAVKKAAFVYAKFPATQEPRDRYAAAFPQAGWKFLDCDQIYGIAGESDWKPLASNLKACGVETVVWVGSPNPNLENLLSAAKQVGYQPKAWLSDTNQYDVGFAKWNAQNGGAGNDVYVRMGAVPFEFAAQVPGVKQYEDLIDKAGGTKALLGVQATSAFLLWATAVKSCGSDVTAKCVLSAAAEQKDWTAGGLHSPTNPGANEAQQCGMLVHLTGGTWSKVAPTGSKLFDCQGKYVVKGLTTDGVKAAKLDAQRHSTVYGSFTP